MDKPYLYNEGLDKLALEVIGTERIHMGIRPFGFHAGNLVSLYIYPYLFCEKVEKLGKPVNFVFFVSINDYEQDELDGPDYKRYPYNIYPKNTTLGYLEDPLGCHKFNIDHWFPIIKSSILKLKERFIGVQIYFVKNSELKNDLKFKEILTNTIKDPFEQLDIYKRFTTKEILPEPVQYAGAVCPFCKRTKGITQLDKINGEYVNWKCEICGVTLNQPYTNFDYWFYHKPLFTARMSVFNIDITFSGDDHFSDGDFFIRKEFMNRFNPELKIPKMFFAPLVLTEDGQRMSKTQKNTKFGLPKELINFCRDNTSKEILINKDLYIKNLKKHEEYINFF